LYLKFT
ncbi:hypothetical protein D029_2728B, partial [Vibrio parahaemolyticus 970107]